MQAAMRRSCPVWIRAPGALALAAAGAGALAAALPVALADEVFLANGRTITGRAVEDGDSVFVSVPGGRIRLDRREIVRIERAPLPEDLYAARAAATDYENPEAVRALAAYAADLGLHEVARSLRAFADEV